MSTIGTLAYGAEIAAAAIRHHLDPRLLAAVAAQETGGPGANAGRNIVGDGGHGHGVFQIDDRYHPFATTRAAMDPARNADFAAGMLADAIRSNGGNVHRALSVYNAGAPNATGTRTDWGDGKPVGYADSVLRHYAWLAVEVHGARAPADPETQRADWRDGIAATNALQSLSASAAVPGGTGPSASVAIQMPPAHSTSSADRAKIEAALMLIDDGTDASGSEDIVDPSRASRSL